MREVGRTGSRNFTQEKASKTGQIYTGIAKERLSEFNVRTAVRSNFSARGGGGGGSEKSSIGSIYLQPFAHPYYAQKPRFLGHGSHHSAERTLMWSGLVLKV